MRFFSALRNRLCWLPLVLWLPFTSTHAANDAPALPALGTDSAQNTVSGLSSGAFMATQFSVAYSASVAGAGIVAGGPYYCAGLGSYNGANRFLMTAMTQCMTPLGPAPSGNQAFRQAQQFANTQEIDETSNIARQRVYIFTGAADSIVKPKVVAQTRAFYVAAGVPAQQLKYVDNINAGHALITDNGTDLSCAANKAPNLNDCNFFQSRDILRHLYGDLQPPVTQLGGELVDFDQSEFTESNGSGLAPVGHAYIPAACRQESCRVHVVFHGCTQEDARIGDRFYRTTGYNELADSNRIVVLYPQIRTNPVRNPKGCWDFWGYSSQDPVHPDFYMKKAPQMAAIWAMLQRLSTPHP
ncbi:extracellular catalytic domain type 2 short-chain-length polyhydroxyalkanoate depolymerase [Chitinimonas sp. BJB300]|uniref:extracellular catalytic domain type 2 short-chain-length polyhydroxyalkanoate depolymerase n=1 Tax=Chitinimonas sp. BJB300 TaxID=1559339 RepID=UPI000C1204D8|nr:PHB depolymerase family esterase [Chitinimonas sp. BJB300]PHV10179.1 poly(3-hydroxybutyrate) depolymerase [Chitinimonas sp. BJB300]TSJ91297.1 poly(3-hydroxybutyrate) depolymerase [Chitinimonas sp. BJB300]